MKPIQVRGPLVAAEAEDLVQRLSVELADTYRPFGAWIIVSKSKVEVGPDGYGIVTLCKPEEEVLTGFTLYGICVDHAEPRCVWGAEAVVA